MTPDIMRASGKFVGVRVHGHNKVASVGKKCLPEEFGCPACLQNASRVYPQRQQSVSGEASIFKGFDHSRVCDNTLSVHAVLRSGERHRVKRNVAECRK